MKKFKAIVIAAALVFVAFDAGKICGEIEIANRIMNKTES